jgi:hypothetical protein
MTRSILVACSFVLVAGVAAADEKETLELKLAGKTNSYAWPYAQSQKDFESAIEDLKSKKKMGEQVIWPAPPVVDQVLQITNKGKEKVTIHVGGDPNLVTLTVKGPGVVTIDTSYSFTTELKMPQPVVLEPGKSHDIAVKWLADGFRSNSRYIYTVAPGDYTLSATYLLSDADGGKGPLLKSDEVKFSIAEPKK